MMLFVLVVVFANGSPMREVSIPFQSKEACEQAEQSPFIAHLSAMYGPVRSTRCILKEQGA